MKRLDDVLKDAKHGCSAVVRDFLASRPDDGIGDLIREAIAGGYYYVTVHLVGFLAGGCPSDAVFDITNIMGNYDAAASVLRTISQAHDIGAFVAQNDSALLVDLATQRLPFTIYLLPWLTQESIVVFKRLSRLMWPFMEEICDNAMITASLDAIRWLHRHVISAPTPLKLAQMMTYLGAVPVAELMVELYGSIVFEALRIEDGNLILRCLLEEEKYDVLEYFFKCDSGLLGEMRLAVAGRLFSLDAIRFLVERGVPWRAIAEGRRLSRRVGSAEHNAYFDSFTPFVAHGDDSEWPAEMIEPLRREVQYYMPKKLKSSEGA
jgi:hypothetical protein